MAHTGSYCCGIHGAWSRWSNVRLPTRPENTGWGCTMACQSWRGIVCDWIQGEDPAGKHRLHSGVHAGVQGYAGKMQAWCANERCCKTCSIARHGAFTVELQQAQAVPQMQPQALLRECNLAHEQLHMCAQMCLLSGIDTGIVTGQEAHLSTHVRLLICPRCCAQLSNAKAPGSKVFRDSSKPL